MTAQAYKLRVANSGPVFTGDAGDVLTMLPDGTAEFQPANGLNTQFVTATQAVTVLDFNSPPTRKFVVTLDASTTFEIAWPTVPRIVIIQLKQGPGAPHTPTFQNEVRFSNGQTLPTWTVTEGHWDELAIDWDGTYATVSYGTNYSP